MKKETQGASDLDFRTYGATWRIWGVILDPVGFGRGPQIDYFLKKLRTNEKKRFMKRVGHKYYLLITFDAKMGGLK